MKFLFSRKSVVSSALALLILAFAAIPAQAEVNLSQCVENELSQPFLYAKDTNLYTLIPGESPVNFGGEGWQLSGGAQIVTETLQDGASGQVLDLPSGSEAVSPVICVTSAYPTARGIVRN